MSDTCKNCGANMKFNPCCGRADGLQSELAAAQAANAKLRDELLDYSAVSDSEKYWHGKYTALTAAVDALLAAADNVAQESHAPAYCRVMRLMQAAAAVKAARGGGK